MLNAEAKVYQITVEIVESIIIFDRIYRHRPFVNEEDIIRKYIFDWQTKLYCYTLPYTIFLGDWLLN